MIFKLEDEATWPLQPSQIFRGASSVSKASEVKKGRGNKSRRGAQSADVASSAGAALAAASPEEVVLQCATKILAEEVQAVRGSAFDMKAIQEPFKGVGRYGSTFRLLVIGAVEF
jgi:hypothetical protein